MRVDSEKCLARHGAVNSIKVNVTNLALLTFCPVCSTGNARLYGLAADIGATPHQINLAVSEYAIRQFVVP